LRILGKIIDGVVFKSGDLKVHNVISIEYVIVDGVRPRTSQKIRQKEKVKDRKKPAPQISIIPIFT
jgi:hypothetical protein